MYPLNRKQALKLDCWSIADKVYLLEPFHCCLVSRSTLVNTEKTVFIKENSCELFAVASIEGSQDVGNMTRYLSHPSTR